VLSYGDQALADLRDADTPIETIIRRFDVGDQPRARCLRALADKRESHLEGLIASAIFGSSTGSSNDRGGLGGP
jgi:hypothetical protein